MFAILLALAGTAHANETWDEVRRYWSAEVGAAFYLQGDLSGNVRDIPRAYAEGEVGGNLPLGGGVFFRNIARVPLGKASPALLLRVDWQRASSGGDFEDYGAYARQTERLDLAVGPGVCIEDDSHCVFLTYAYRTLTSSDDNYPITNLAAVLGDPEGLAVEAFTPRYLAAVLGQGLVDVLLNQVDFDNQRVSVDVADTLVMNGGMLATVMGAGKRLTVDGAVGYFVVTQSHSTSARVVADVSENPDEVETFAYDYDKDFGMVALDLGMSVGLLPGDMPAQLALGLQGNLMSIVDLDPDRTVGNYLGAKAYLSAKW